MKANIEADELREFIRSNISTDNGTGCWEWARHINTSGYGGCAGSKWHRKYNKSMAHQLSIIAFKELYNASLLVLHKCNNRKCSTPDHLYLGTHRDNKRDSIIKGTAKIPDNKGTRCGTCKLSEREVLEIRDLEGYLTQQQIAEIYNVSRPHIGDILLRQRWAWL